MFPHQKKYFFIELIAEGELTYKMPSDEYLDGKNLRMKYRNKT